MFSDRRTGFRSVFPAGIPAWALVVWLAATGLIFNLYVIHGMAWRGVLAYEVPSRAALGQGHWWTLFSYAWVNTGTDAPTEFLFGPLNVVLLFIVARLVEVDLPGWRFLLLCAGCALAGSLAWLPLHLASGEALLSGGTVLVFGLLAFWCFTTPDEPIPARLFFVTAPRPQVIFWVVLALQAGAFLCFELPWVFGIPGVLHTTMDNSAQLGGMFAGWVFSSVWRRAPVDATSGIAMEKIAPRHPSPFAMSVPVGRATEAELTAQPAAKTPFASRRELREEVDRILDKINGDGFGALSEQERRILDLAKDLLTK
jgi:membrane associated rhomboid family serine protease